MSSRDEILALIRSNRPQVERPLPAVSLFDAHPPRSLLTEFKASLERMGGHLSGPARWRRSVVTAPGEDCGRQGHLLDRAGDRWQPGHQQCRTASGIRRR